MTKPFVKDAAAHFRNLLSHLTREYEPTSEHVLKRLLRPLCRDLKRIIERGTAEDVWETVNRLREECEKVEL
ncbi:MAG: hypothetical protein ACTSP1_16725 [Candidatus Freyarchaeota archaeon]